MNDLSKLRETSDRVLYTLTADESLKNRILLKAAAGENSNQRRRAFRALPAVCMVVAVLLIGAAALNNLQPVSPAGSVEMNYFAAGDKETVPSGNSFSSEMKEAGPENIVSVEITGTGIIDDPDQCSDLMSLLNEEAIPVEHPAAENAYAVIFRTAEGEEIRFNAEDPYLFGDESWTCPGFFARFRKMLDQ